MKRALLTVCIVLIASHYSYAQEIIPFPDLSEHQDYSKNGGRSEDERNYAIYSHDYQVALEKLDEETDQILRMRTEETDPEVINRYNEELEAIRLKKMALLSEADLVEDLQKFY